MSPESSPIMDEPETATLQREKLVAEIRNLKVDNSLANRLFTTILSLSAVAIAVSQIWMARQQGFDQRAQAIQDEELKKIELHIRQVESGLKLSQFAIDERSLFLSPSVDEQVRAVRLVQAMLPPEEARSMLEAIGKIATQAEVLSVVETGKQQLSEEAGTRAPSQATPTALAAPPPAASASQQPAVPPAAASHLPGAFAGNLTVYFHVQRQDDRDLANAVAGSLPAQFPSAGVQLIPRGPLSAQVRYYKPDQTTQAKELAKQLAEQVKSLTGADVTFQPFDIGKTFPNLPSDRVEVWFAPSMPKLKP
jgi:hypothetical protein